MRDDARGSTFGTGGLLVVAVGVAVFAAKAAMWMVLSAANGAWVVVALTTYFTGRYYGTRVGDDR